MRIYSIGFACSKPWLILTDIHQLLSTVPTRLQYQGIPNIKGQLSHISRQVGHWFLGVVLLSFLGMIIILPTLYIILYYIIWYDIILYCIILYYINILYVYNYVSIYQLSTGQVIRQREEERTQKILFRGEAGSGQAGPGPGNPHFSSPFRTHICVDVWILNGIMNQKCWNTIWASQLGQFPSLSITDTRDIQGSVSSLPFTAAALFRFSQVDGTTREIFGILGRAAVCWDHPVQTQGFVSFGWTHLT